MQPNWAKVVGELIADHEVSTRKQIEPLVARIAELEARPIQKGDAGELGLVPPELAEQIKQAIHLLHESPPIRFQNVSLRTASPLPPPRLRRIERTENGYMLIDDEPQA